MSPRPSLTDHRDQAAFFLNLSRLGGGDVVPYRVEGRPAFLINTPELAEEVVVRREARIWNPPHPYRDLAPHYRPVGQAMLRLSQGTADRRAALEKLLGRESVASRWFDRLMSNPAHLAVDVDFELKRLLLCLVTDTLFGMDVEPLSADFVAATNFLEECQANAAHDRVPDGLLSWALAAQEGLARQIAERGRMFVPGQDPAAMQDAIIRTLLNGYNATATALSWTLQLLALHPGHQAAVRERLVPALGGGVEAVLLVRAGRQALMESLRLFPPAWILGREALEDMTLGGVAIPRGAILSISPYTMHRRAALWDAPSEFRPERFAPGGARPKQPFAYFPFGGGQRSCPAARAVIPQLQVLLALVLARVELRPADVPPPRPRGLVSLRPHPGVFLFFRPSTAA